MKKYYYLVAPVPPDFRPDIFLIGVEMLIFRRNIHLCVIANKVQGII